MTSEDELELLNELVNIGMGSAAGQLSAITQNRIILKAPSILVIDLNDFKEGLLPGKLSSNINLALIDFEGPFNGSAGLVLSEEAGDRLAQILMNEEVLDQDLRSDALNEITNIVIGSVLGKIAEIYGDHISFHVPELFSGDFSHLVEMRGQQKGYRSVIVAHAEFEVDAEDIKGDVAILLSGESLSMFLDIAKGLFNPPASQEIMSPIAIEVFSEVVSIGVGRAAASLSEMLEERVYLDLPTLRFLHVKEINSILPELSEEYIAVEIPFEGGVSGNSTLLFSVNSALNLISKLTGESYDVVDFLEEGTIQEVGNIVLNAVMGSLADMLRCTLTFDVPRFSNRRGGVLLKSLIDHGVEHQLIVVAETQFSVQDLKISGDLLLIFTPDSVGRMVQELEKMAA